MKNLDFEWLTDEFMLYCRSTQLREKTMSSYEQTLHLFGRWLADELKIYTVDTPFLRDVAAGYASLPDFCRSQSRKPSVGIRMRVPMRIVGNPGSFTSS